MQIDAERFGREKQFMNEYWAFRKNFGTPQGDDKEGEAYWQNMLAEWDRIANLCDNDPYCLSLMMVCVADLGSRYRTMFGKPDYDKNLVFFNEVADQINRNLLRCIGLNMKFERVV